MKRIFLLAGIVGLAATGVGLVVDRKQAMFAFLAAYTCVASVALGALVLLLIMHAASARWFIVYRRIVEALALMIVPLVPLFAVVAVGVNDLYSWSNPAGIADEDVRAKVIAKHAWLSPGGFVVRGAVYLAVWLVVVVVLRRFSRRQDDDGDPKWVDRARWLSSAALPAVALTITFAAFDWLMSLTPAWMSTVFGIYVWSGGFVTAIAVTGAIAYRLRMPEIRPTHTYAIGRLMLAFTIFWAYIAYAQGFIIWIANKPDEVVWYVPRVHGSWGVVGLVLGATQFVVPFVVLLSQELKYRAGALAAIAGVIVVGHVVDSWWNVLPVLHPDGLTASWVDLAALAGVGGVAAAFAGWVLGRAPLLPAKEPRLAEALAYKSIPTATSVERAFRGDR